MRAFVLLITLGALAALAIRVREQNAGPVLASGEGAALPDLPPAAPDILASVQDSATALMDAIGATVAKVTGWAPPATATAYLPAIAQAEADHGLPAGLLARQLYQESRFRPEIIDGSVASPAGALGIAQFMPATAQDLGVDPLDPKSAINGAAAYMRRLFDSLGSWPEALAAYNWGIGNVKKKGLDAAPAETRNYVQQITADVPIT